MKCGYAVFGDSSPVDPDFAPKKRMMLAAMTTKGVVAVQHRNSTRIAGKASTCGKATERT
jgi:hypothetical protein